MTRGKLGRWLAVSVFALASAWNYLDRQLLSAAIPRVSAEFHLTNTDYGWMVAAFGLAYALASPLAGWFLDRVGLEAGIAWAVGFWSIAAGVCGWTRTFAQLVTSRVFLGVGESAGIPAAGKLNTIYLEPENRALGAAVTQVGLTIGSVAAPLLVRAYTGWRSPFFICSALGLAWIPLWMLVRKKIPPYQTVPPRSSGSWELLRDRRLILLAAVNVFWMVGYVLWSYWTTVYLAVSFHLSAAEANAYAWIPPVASTAGGFLGGWLSRRIASSGATPLRARVSAVSICAFGCLICVVTPLCRTPLLATLVAAASYFWTTAGSVNVYTIPLDIWGGEHAGVAISALVFSYGVLQTAISPVIGAIVDRFGFGPVCWMIAAPPFIGLFLLRKIAETERPKQTARPAAI
jgi:ACS family hexuronate transporter-like MFS transporter